MKMAVFTGLRRLEVIDVPEPSIERPSDVLLGIDRVGICGSDIHYYLDGRIGNQVLSYPAALGHECSGTVLAVGDEVRNVVPGDRAAIDPAISCGMCDQCRLGRFHTCRLVRFMGSPNQAPGAAAERVVMPAKCCSVVPGHVTQDQAALVEPLSIGLHAVRLSQLFEGAAICILGAGPIGLGVLLCSKALGHNTVAMADLLEERLAVAMHCGADSTTVNVGWDQRATASASPPWRPVPEMVGRRDGSLREGRCLSHPTMIAPDGFDFVFECTGDPKCIEEGQRLLKCGGTLVIVGIPGTDQVSFDPHHMRRAELTFKSVRRQNGCVESVIDLLAQGKINADRLITHHFPLEDIAAAFEIVADYRDGVIKAMIDVR
jgi:L-iditol 2-dehydrogenase